MQGRKEHSPLEVVHSLDIDLEPDIVDIDRAVEDGTLRAGKVRLD